MHASDSNNDVPDRVPKVTLIEGEFGTAQQLTQQVIQELEARKIHYRRVRGSHMAHRDVPLPTVIASFDDNGRDVAYQGYGRICRDFLPRFKTG